MKLIKFWIWIGTYRIVDFDWSFNIFSVSEIYFARLTKNIISGPDFDPPSICVDAESSAGALAIGKLASIRFRGSVKDQSLHPSRHKRSAQTVFGKSTVRCFRNFSGIVPENVAEDHGRPRAISHITGWDTCRVYVSRERNGVLMSNRHDHLMPDSSSRMS